MPIIIPLRLSNGETIRDFKSFKEALTKKENYNDLMQYIASGDMESFLNGHGKKKLVELIQKGRESGKNNIEILKELGSALGLEIKIEMDDTEITVVSESKEECKRKILSGDEKCILPSVDVKLDKPLVIKNKKYIKGHLTKFTKISLPRLEVDTDKEVIFENLDILSVDGKSINFFIKSGKVILKNIRFTGVCLHLIGGELVFENTCKITNVDTGILLKSGKAIGLDNVEFQSVAQTWMIDEENITDNKNIEIIFTKPEETVVEKPILISNISLNISYNSNGKKRLVSIQPNAFTVMDGGRLKLENIELVELRKENNKETSSEPIGLIKISGGNLELSNSIVRKSSSSGIYIHSGKAHISESEIKENNGYGIYIEQSQEIRIIKTTFESNKKNQLYISSSQEVFLRNLTVAGGYGSGIYSGIYIGSESNVDIEESNINANKGNGIQIKDSVVRIASSTIQKNGTEGKPYPQIGIENSEVQIDKCKVKNANNGTGIYISSKSNVDIDESDINANNGNGINIKDSKLRITSSTISKNGTEAESYPQIWIKNSEVQIDKCEVKNTIGKGDGIRIVSGNVKVSNSEITGNKGGIAIKGKSSVLIEECQIYENGTDDYNDGVGVYSDEARVTLKKVRTWGNKWGLSMRNEKNVVVSDCEFKDAKTTNIDCYITTAVITALNKPDNCYELNLLRWFRDNWLRYQKDGELLIKDYYKKAPGIVKAINNTQENNKIYQKIWDDYIKKCIELIENKEYEKCKELYIKMVNDLEREYQK